MYGFNLSHVLIVVIVSIMIVYSSIFVLGIVNFIIKMITSHTVLFYVL